MIGACVLNEVRDNQQTNAAKGTSERITDDVFFTAWARVNQEPWDTFAIRVDPSVYAQVLSEVWVLL